MARTHLANRLTTAHRTQQLAVRARTLRDLMRLWPALDWRALQASYPAWFTAVSAVIARDRRTSAGLSSAYLRAFRAAEGIPGRPAIQLAAVAPVEQVETSMRVTSRVAFKRAIASGATEATAAQIALVMSSGAATRLVLNGGRETITASLSADPEASGWRRLVSSSACDFCGLLAARGAVYSAATVDFGSHDHCACMVEPAYGVDLREVRDHTPSPRQSEAARARTRDWVKTAGA